jgi:putative nucleotidyltransferase with HDIG domain
MIEEANNFRVELHPLVVALSEALGLVGGAIVDHGKRVAFMALSIAEAMGLAPGEVDDLRNAALLHDAGVTRTKTRQFLMQPDWDGVQEHCLDGAALLRDFARFDRVSQIVRHHHTKWLDMASTDLDPDTAVLANLIFMADRIDIMIDWDVELILNRERIESGVTELSGNYFNPEAVMAFRRKSQVEVFWLSLYSRYLTPALDRFRPRQEVLLDLGELESLSSIFARIVDSKSPYTLGHCNGVARLCDHFARAMGFDASKVRKMRIAGLVHDLGKLAVPDEILEKPSFLTAEEFQVVKRHPFETYHILSGVPGLSDIRDWAAFHHEKMDGSGYPFHLNGQDLGPEHLIVILSDILQALVQDRPYRPSLSQDHVLDILYHVATQQPAFSRLLEIVRQDYDHIATLATGEDS